MHCLHFPVGPFILALSFQILRRSTGAKAASRVASSEHLVAVPCLADASPETCYFRLELATAFPQSDNASVLKIDL
jgi:hypothetical protein